MKKLFVIALAAFLTAACPGIPKPNPHAESLEEAVKKAGYTPYRPIRSNWGPGFIFEGTMPSPVPACPNLYGEELKFDDLANADIYFQNITMTNSGSFDLSLDFLKNLVGAENSAKLELGSVANSNDLSITWGEVKEFAYFLSTAYSGRPIHKDCLAMLRQKKQNGTLSQLSIVTRAIAVKGLTYELKQKGSGGGGLDVKIAEVLDLKLGKGSWSYTNDGKLTISKPAFLGYAKPMKLENFIDTGEVSDIGPKVIFTFTAS